MWYSCGVGLCFLLSLVNLSSPRYSQANRDRICNLSFGLRKESITKWAAGVFASTSDYGMNVCVHWASKCWCVTCSSEGLAPVVVQKWIRHEKRGSRGADQISILPMNFFFFLKAMPTAGEYEDERVSGGERAGEDWRQQQHEVQDEGRK